MRVAGRQVEVGGGRGGGVGTGSRCSGRSPLGSSTTGVRGDMGGERGGRTFLTAAGDSGGITI